MRIAVIGGGPIGVEAALYGACAGFDVQLYEKARLCENVRQWGHVGLFTEWGRNRSPLACRILAETGFEFAAADSTSTGDELAEYVMRLAALPQLRGRILPQTEVASITRESCLKSDFIGDPRRAEFPFRLLLRGAFGEKTRGADVVLDATGVWQNPNPVGSGGARCRGEEAAANRIDYHLPDVAGRDLKRFANRHTLVVGSGHSAASTLRSIGELMDEYPHTRLTWIVRRDVPEHGLPYTLVENDPSPHRDALHRRANELALDPRVRFLPRSVVEAVQHDALARNQAFKVTVRSWVDGREVVEEIPCDNVAAHTGFRPDRSLWSELQFAEHPAIGGPLTLGNAIVAQNRHSGTGLSTGYAEKREEPIGGEVAAEPDKFLPVVGGPELLRTTEPNFYVLGIKSYGRDAGFLMNNGFRQVRDVFKLISGDESLDLYGGQLD